MGTKPMKQDQTMQIGPPMVNKVLEKSQIVTGINTMIEPSGIKRARKSLDLYKDIPSNDAMGEKRDELQIVPLQRNKGVWKNFTNTKGKKGKREAQLSP